MKPPRPFVLALVTLAVACESEIVPEPYHPSSAHDAYRHSLEEAALLSTALGRDWKSAAREALEKPTPIRLPFREALYVDSKEAFATGYRFSVRRGQRIQVRLELEAPAGLRLFIDLFRLPDDEGGQMVHVASGAEGELRLAFEPRRDGAYLLRVQSELLRGGRVSVVVRNVASLAFPVEGHDAGSVGSRFGVPREGGRRQHHGIDIFAPRHTPVQAPSRAWVRRVDDWKLGGRVVWLHDRQRDLHLYFAHLETQDVREDTWVERGEQIGSVGNSGNARTTPPHLHFGVYERRRGPIDPFHFVYEPRVTPPEVGVTLTSLGQWLRTERDDVALREAPDPRARVVRDVALHTPLRVRGAAARSFRVSLPDGASGFVRGRDLEPIATAVASLALEAPTTGVLDSPARDAPAIAELPSGSRLDVLGRYGEFVMVPSGIDRPGWVFSP